MHLLCPRVNVMNLKFKFILISNCHTKTFFVYLIENCVVGKKAEDSLETYHSAVHHVYDVSLRVTCKLIVILKASFCKSCSTDAGIFEHIFVHNMPCTNNKTSV